MCVCVCLLEHDRREELADHYFCIASSVYLRVILILLEETVATVLVYADAHLTVGQVADPVGQSE